MISKSANFEQFVPKLQIRSWPNFQKKTIICWGLKTLLNLVLLRSEIPSGICAKLRTVAASNNRDHARKLSSRTLVIKFNRSHVNIGRAFTSQSLLLLLARATHMMVLFFTHIPFVVNHTFNAIPPERLQQYQPLLLLALAITQQLYLLNFAWHTELWHCTNQDRNNCILTL